MFIQHADQNPINLKLILSVTKSNSVKAGYHYISFVNGYDVNLFWGFEDKEIRDRVYQNILDLMSGNSRTLAV